jgi:hypothetical protein
MFCDITLCIYLKVSRHFGGIYRSHLQGRTIYKRSKRKQDTAEIAISSHNFILFDLVILNIYGGGSVDYVARSSCVVLCDVFYLSVVCWFVLLLFLFLFKLQMWFYLVPVVLQ